MARVTVEDCVGEGEGKTFNRFELCVLASQRTKDIHSGSPITVAEDNDKKTVISLREIAAGNLKIDELRVRFVNSLHPQSALGTLDEELDSVDKDTLAEEFLGEEGNFGLTEEQMLIDEEGMTFEDMDLSEEDKL